MPSLSRIIIGFGALSLVAGLLAVLNPFAASIAAATLAALGLFAAGVGKAAAAIDADGWRERAAPTLAAAALSAISAVVLLRPVAGAGALLTLVGALLLVSGVAKLLWAARRRGDGVFWPALVSGLLSVLLAWFVFADLRAGRIGLLGVLLGVELMLNGMVLMAAGAAARKLARHVRGRIGARIGDMAGE